MGVDPVRPAFVPDPTLDRQAMETLQEDIAAAAVFADGFGFDPGAVCTGADGPVPNSDGDGEDENRQARLGESGRQGGGDRDGDRHAPEAPLVAGVDQAFVGDRAVSAVVVLRDGEVVERAHAVEPVEIPYVPGLLSFREGGAILAAFAALECVPDLAFVDGSGRIHFREAGLATHVGVTLDLPTVGVAKNLLCGTPRQSLDGKLPEGARVAVEADDDVTAPAGTVIGYAVQTRQFEGGNRHVNPLYVSPGHRVSAGTAADLVEQCGAGYKLPEPTRLADTYAADLKTDIGGG